MKRLFVLGIVMLASGCTSIPSRPPRAAGSSYGCMQAAIDNRLPAAAPDKKLHCLAAGLIARYCSPTEARIAGAGKEFRDAFTAGDTAEWGDWKADLKGIGCAEHASSDDELFACCEAQ
jgi:hypothetical protein